MPTAPKALVAARRAMNTAEKFTKHIESCDQCKAQPLCFRGKTLADRTFKAEGEARG